jgi:hypothetical protein
MANESTEDVLDLQHWGDGLILDARIAQRDGRIARSTCIAADLCAMRPSLMKRAAPHIGKAFCLVID